MSYSRPIRRRLVLAVAIAIAATAIAGCTRAPGGGDSGNASLSRVGGLRVGVSNDPAPPRIGDNALLVAVRSAGGEPERGATLEVMVSMAEMGGMPRMESRGVIKETRPGLYRATYGLAMNGDWDVVIRIRPAHGEPVEASYRLSTSVAEVRFAEGTPAAGEAGVAPTTAAGGMAGMSHGGPPPGTPSGSADAGASAGVVTIDEARRQAIGVRTAPIEMRDLTVSVRAVGRVAYDERRAAEVALKFGGFVREIRADFVGRAVRAGGVLFTAYSPELLAAQQEYLEALRPIGDDSSSARADNELADAAKRRLGLWDVPAGEIAAIARSGRAREAMPIVSPASGVVIEKSIVRGSAFSAGQVLYKIASTDPAWVIASIYPIDLPLVRLGQRAKLSHPNGDAAPRTGTISFIAPALDAETRTGEVRIEVSNGTGDLKPGMFLDVQLEIPLGRRLALPESAVLPTGNRYVVFVDLGGGRLAPREVRLGARAAGYYEVLGGLEARDVVVTSGNFLVASESKLRSAGQNW